MAEVLVVRGLLGIAPSVLVVVRLALLCDHVDRLADHLQNLGEGVARSERRGNARQAHGVRNPALGQKLTDDLAPDAVVARHRELHEGGERVLAASGAALAERGERCITSPRNSVSVVRWSVTVSSSESVDAIVAALS